MATEVAEPQTAEPIFTPPQAEQEPLKVNRGELWKKEFDKLTHPKEEAEKPVETPKDEPKPEVKPDAKIEEKSADKPTSPLDVVTADKKPEVKEPDVLDELDSVTSPKSEDWKKLKGIAKTHRDEKKALETTIAELKKTPKADPEEIARLSKERDDLKQSLDEREELIKTADVRLSKDYRDLAKKRDDTVQKLGERVKAYGVDPAAFISALALPEGKYKTEQIDALMAEVAPSYQAKINILVDRLEQNNEAIQEFEKDAPKKYEELQAKREAALMEQQEASIKHLTASFHKRAEQLPAEIVTLREVPEDVPGGTEWNQAIRQAKEEALRIMTPGGSDLEETTDTAWMGRHYKPLMNMFLKDHTELVEARKRLAEYDSGGPDFKGSGKPKGEAKLTPSQKYQKALEQLQGSPTE